MEGFKEIQKFTVAETHIGKTNKCSHLFDISGYDFENKSKSKGFAGAFYNCKNISKAWGAMKEILTTTFNKLLIVKRMCGKSSPWLSADIKAWIPGIDF